MKTTSCNGIIDISVEDLTPCLIDRASGEILATTTVRICPKPCDYSGWRFDWSRSMLRGFDVYAIYVEGESAIQGMIALRIDPGNSAVQSWLIESSPHNIGKNGRLVGIGAHLFAVACKVAKDAGYDTVYFDAKSGLIEYYANKIGAQQIGNSQRMILAGKVFYELVERYYGERT